MFKKLIICLSLLLLLFVNKTLANVDYEMKVQRAREIVDHLSLDNELLSDLSSHLYDTRIANGIASKQFGQMLSPFTHLDHRPLQTQHFYASMAPFEIYECEHN